MCHNVGAPPGCAGHGVPTRSLWLGCSVIRPCHRCHTPLLVLSGGSGRPPRRRFCCQSARASPITASDTFYWNFCCGDRQLSFSIFHASLFKLSVCVHRLWPVQNQSIQCWATAWHLVFSDQRQPIDQIGPCSSKSQVNLFYLSFPKSPATGL